jgi:shikimate dehydrogenase
MTDRYAVIGNPIAHSKSPQIHMMFAEQTGQDINYEAIEAPLGLGEFGFSVTNFFNQGGKGMNVTLPFKLEAFLNADHKGQRAQSALAANTLTLKNQPWHFARRQAHTAHRRRRSSTRRTLPFAGTKSLAATYC